MPARLLYLVLPLLLLSAPGCTGDNVIVPEPGGIILSLIVVMAVVVTVVGVVDRLLGRKINRTLARMANAWMRGRQRR